eukprot:m.214902 g.214902  ORF g.214902 m.214902 type:complete len:784 (-) comp33180_c0_seq1:242-2593(-)
MWCCSVVRFPVSRYSQVLQITIKHPTPLQLPTRNMSSKRPLDDSSTTSGSKRHCDAATASMDGPHVESLARAASGVYEKVALTPVLSSARIDHSTRSNTGGFTNVRVTFKQDVMKTNKSITFSQEAVFMNDDKLCGAYVTSAQSDETTHVSTTSPSGRWTIKFSKGDSATGADPMVELWSGSRLEKVAPLGALHSTIYTNTHTFGGFSWNHDEEKLLYVAESKQKQQGNWWSTNDSHEKKGDKFAWSESWGEQHATVVQPTLYFLDVASLKPTLAVDDGFINFSCGHPRFDPNSKENHFVFTAWPHHARKLGIVYCSNRESGVWLTKIGGTPTKLVGSEKVAARAPIFTPDGKTLVWLTNAVGGPHNMGCIVETCEWKDDVVNGVNHNQPFEGKGPQAIDSHLNILKLDDYCWLTNETFLTTTFNKSSKVIIQGNIKTGELSYLPHNQGDGIHGDWVMRDVLISKNHRIEVLATFETPSQPPQLYISRAPSPSHVGRSWTRIDLQTTDECDHVAHTVIDFDRSPVSFQATLVSPKNESLTKTPPPLIVRPHGGPHSNSSLFFDTFNMAFVKLGFAVLTVNYRGSLGFTNEGVESLLGKVGTQDVADVNDAVTHVLEKGWADSTRVGVFGGSHGGFLTGHLTAQFPERYRAAVMRNPVVDISAMMPITDIPDWCFVEAGLNFDEQAKRNSVSVEALAQMKKVSPITHVDDVKAPTMILIGAQDRRVPVSQGWIWHYALQARGVVSKVHVYPDDHHALNGVECAGDVFVNTCRWFGEHLNVEAKV